MKELAPYDRPREKLKRAGSSDLGDNELLALIIGVGFRHEGALALATRVLDRVGGLYRLARTPPPDLQRVCGIGPARAAQVAAALELGRRSLVRGALERPRFSSPRQLAAYLIPHHGRRAVEEFGIIMLDTKRIE